MAADNATIMKARQETMDLLNNGEYEKAEPQLREIVKQVRDQKDAETFMWQRRLAEALVGQRKFVEAEPVAFKATSGFESKYGENDEDTLASKYLYAESLSGQRKNSIALPFAQAAYEGLEANMKRGPEHHVTLLCKALYARLLMDCGLAEEGRRLADSAVDGLEAYESKMEVNLSSNSRRPSSVEVLAAKKLREVLSRFVKDKTVKRNESKDTSSTRAPDDDEVSSGLSSKVMGG